MPKKIVRLRPVPDGAITVGPESTVLPDGTIVNPVPFVGVDVTLADGTQVQVEGPPEDLTPKKIREALRLLPNHQYGEISEGDEI